MEPIIEPKSLTKNPKADAEIAAFLTMFLIDYNRLDIKSNDFNKTSPIYPYLP